MLDCFVLQGSKNGVSGDSGPCAMRLASISKESGPDTELATTLLHKMEGGLVMGTQVNHIHVVRELASLVVCLFVCLTICLLSTSPISIH